MPTGPDLSLESEHSGPVAGIDEAGRGPWAGPVVAAAVILDITCIPPGINDSKRLRPLARERLYAQLREAAQVGVGAASVEEIDALNILSATKLAMRRAVEALGALPTLTLIDGNQPPSLLCPARCVVGGDGVSLSIAAASIIAKVTRDRLMRELGLLHPAYGFERHMGYGTPEHQRALRAHGITPHHRRSFAPIRRCLEERGKMEGTVRKCAGI